MERKQIAFYYLMFATGFISGRIASFGMEIVRAVFDLITFTMQIAVLLVLSYVIIISIERTKKQYFNR